MDLSKWTVLSLLDSKFLQTLKLALVFGNLGSEVIMVTDEDEVYAMGCNSSGCLGVGDSHSTLEPRKIEMLSKKKIKGLAYGSGLHLAAYNESGELYTWGYNTYAQLGNGNTTHSTVPSLVSGALSEKKIVQVSCGNHHCLALASDGEVFSWGQNNAGQVGSGSTTGQSVPRRDLSAIGGLKVVAVACGQLSSMALLEDGELYGWGYNGNGELGIGTNSNHHNPIRVINLNKVFITQELVKKLITCPLYKLLANAEGLFVLADAYCELELKFRCENLIRQSATVENVAALYATSVKYDAQELQDFCLRFSVHHLTAVVGTEAFSKLDESSLKQFITHIGPLGAFRY